MPDDPLPELKTAMACAVMAQDFELAARLRDQIAKLTGEGNGADTPMPPSKIRRQVPGAMGLGTDQQIYQPPSGWVPPSRPDPLTAARKGRGRKRS